MGYIQSERIHDNNVDAIICGYTPLSFGVMLKVYFLNETNLAAGMSVRLVYKHDGRQVETTIINVEKDYTVYITEVEFRRGQTGNVVINYTDELLHYPLSKAGIKVVLNTRKEF